MQDHLRQVHDCLVSYRKLFNKELTKTQLDHLLVIEEKLDQSVITIAFLGMGSRGKSSLINAILGTNLSEAGAIDGITKNAKVHHWISATKVVETDQSNQRRIKLIDTQGIDEVDGEIKGDLAIELAKQADLILFVIAGDMTRIEQNAISQLQKLYKPILLIFNKIDLYPEESQTVIYQALQYGEIGKLISAQEIILTSAKPKPVKVRIQYLDQSNSEEIWEQPEPNIKDLQTKILDLLNKEEKELLAINGLRSLLEVQNAITDKYLEKLNASTAIAALIFIVEISAMLISPFQWLDALISGIISSVFTLWMINKYPIQNQYLWLILIVMTAYLSGKLSLDYAPTNYIQILIVGLSISYLSKGLPNDIDQSRADGKLGAKRLISKIIQSADKSSILTRFQ
jgi:small GTP-binding protein